MKIKYLLLLFVLSFYLSGCDFTMEDNANANIKFDVNTTADNKEFQLGIQSTEVMIDWGDGTQDVKNGESGQEIATYSHTYAQKGTYRVTLSTLRVTGIDTYRDYPVTNLEINECPFLMKLDLNNIADLKTFSPSGCKNLYALTIKDCVSLYDIDLSRLPRLAGISLINTGLTDLDISKNKWLRNVNIQDSPFTDISFDKNKDLREVAFKNTKIKNLSFAQNTKLYSLYSIDNLMDTNDIDFMFITLPMFSEIEAEKVLSVRGNPGEKLCTQSIAKTKGWQIK